MRVLEKNVGLPEPKHVPLERLVLGAFDSHFVSATGLLRAVRQHRGHHILGVSYTLMNALAERAGFQLWVASADQIQVTENTALVDFSRPMQTV